MAVLVVGRPDVAGDGGCHSGVSVAVARVSQERAFVIQQATEEFKIKNVKVTNLDAASMFELLHATTKKICCPHPMNQTGNARKNQQRKRSTL